MAKKIEDAIREAASAVATARHAYWLTAEGTPSEIDAVNALYDAQVALGILRSAQARGETTVPDGD